MRKYLISESYDYYEDRVVRRKWFRVKLDIALFVEALLITVPFIYVGYVTEFVEKFKGVL